MPILSSGQVVKISSERARYHATRLNIDIHRDTPHQHLYQLVDIVFAGARDKPAGRHTRYQFSGHRLADKNWLASLSAEDRHRLLEWFEEPYVRYEIEGARRRLIHDDLPAAIISLPYPEDLYSSLRKFILAMSVTSMPARQWQQTLSNLRQKGIRQEELNWSGVMEYLVKPGADPQRRISKDALLTHIDFSSIRLEMTNELVADKNENNKLVNRAKYRHISLFGGEDYREWLISLPDYQESYFCPHFTERNILLHIRSKTRFDIQGRKLLFIEEIQSDWHQPGVKNTKTHSRVRVPPAPFRQEWVSLGLKLMLLHVVKEGFDGLAWADGEVQKARYKADIPSIRRIYDKEISRHLLGLARNWSGRISETEIETKAPWLQIKPIKRVRSNENRHECLKLPEYDRQGVLAIFDQYAQTVRLQLPVFIIPKGMVHSMRREGLPLFGDNIMPMDRQERLIKQ